MLSGTYVQEPRQCGAPPPQGRVLCQWQVSFEQDVILNPANEYEVLQLLLNECRERLAAYAGE